MYNLANIYIYDENVKQDLDKAIKLLINSSHKFDHSHVLLCIALVKKFGYNLDEIEDYIQKTNSEKSSTNTLQIRERMLSLKLNDNDIFANLYETYRDQLYLYDFLYDAVPHSEFIEPKKDSVENSKAHLISELFLEGFGIEI